MSDIEWHDAAIVVRQFTAIGPSPHVDGHDFYGFSKLPPDEQERRYTMLRYSPEPPSGFVTEYDGKGHWRHIRATQRKGK